MEEGEEGCVRVQEGDGGVCEGAGGRGRGM